MRKIIRDKQGQCLNWLVKCRSEEKTKHLADAGTEYLKAQQKKYLKREISLEQEVEFQMKDFFIRCMREAAVYSFHLSEGYW